MPKSYAIFSAQYPPHLGGIELFTQNLAVALAERGHRVVVVTNDTEGLGAGFSCEKGFEVLRLPCVPLVSGRLPIPVTNGQLKSLMQELGARHFDGVLINARFYPHSLLGMKFAKSQGLVPVVLDHGSAYLSFSNAVLDPIVRLYEDGITAWGRRFGAAYYGISAKSAEWLSYFGIKAQGVIPNAIDAAAFRRQASDRDIMAELGLPAGTFVVAFVGRLIPEKGIDVLIEASRSEELAKRGVVFVLAGDGPKHVEVEAARSASLRWVGPLGRPEVAALLLQSDALCLPTRSEGFCTTLLEASACGCPSVVTDVGGARELIPSAEYGTIVESADVEKVVAALARLADDRGLAKAQGDRCCERVERDCSWADTAAVFEAAMAAEGRP